jgi:hypothetical protein
MPHNSPDVHKVRDSIRRALASVQDHAYAALGWAAIEAYSRVTHVRGGRYQNYIYAVSLLRKKVCSQNNKTFLRVENKKNHFLTEMKRL